MAAIAGVLLALPSGGSSLALLGAGVNFGFMGLSAADLRLKAQDEGWDTAKDWGAWMDFLVIMSGGLTKAASAARAASLEGLAQLPPTGLAHAAE